MRWRPSVVGKCTSTIWMVENFSSTARGVSPGAKVRRRCLSVSFEAIGHKGDKDVCFNARLLLVVNRPDRQIIFELFEGLFDLGQLDVVLPQLSRVLSAEIRAQQVMPFAPV